MRKMIFSLISVLLLAGCNASTPSKGQDVNECMNEKSPEECDREITIRRSNY